ncbi:hypothetical protein [Thalassovita mediterranea]|jgi:hypothetical protein|uniref:Uncharacterized protein n=1 Tax=Thalassovita mediterranea TaxID=340021 RepID=A0A0P1GM66_9RHOB|nr:hypothetical protein [Thalassovita mediterranea]CUH83513.1 hypothetical protein TM5383_00704 [Thalassovita mediterranea]SIS34482.1 hypothetical protein SAMN05421685_11192 [Thalassovita mediterranea]
MIESLPYCVFGVAVVVTVVAQLVLWFRYSCGGKVALNVTALKERVETYAALKKGKGTLSEDHTVDNSELLSAGGHEVLLGTLKKVETKSAALSTIIVFAMGAFLTVVFSDSGAVACSSGSNSCEPNGYDAYGLLTVVAALNLLAPLYHAFVGIGHLDTFDSRVGVDQGKALGAKEMQLNLMSDLLKKERGYRFSKLVSAFVILTYFFVLIADALWVTFGA